MRILYVYGPFHEDFVPRILRVEVRFVAVYLDDVGMQRRKGQRGIRVYGHVHPVIFPVGDAFGGIACVERYGEGIDHAQRTGHADVDEIARSDFPDRTRQRIGARIGVREDDVHQDRTVFRLSDPVFRGRDDRDRKNEILVLVDLVEIETDRNVGVFRSGFDDDAFPAERVALFGQQFVIETAVVAVFLPVVSFEGVGVDRQIDPDVAVEFPAALFPCFSAPAPPADTAARLPRSE